jgi:hypothetical protein
MISKELDMTEAVNELFTPVTNTHGDITCQHLSDAEYSVFLKQLARLRELTKRLVDENQRMARKSVSTG